MCVIIREMNPRDKILVEVSELNELLILIGKSTEAKRVQEILDSLVKAYKVSNVFCSCC